MRSPKKVIIGNYCSFGGLEKRTNKFGLEICELYKPFNKEKGICNFCGQWPVRVAIYDSKMNYISHNRERFYKVLLLHLKLTNIYLEKKLIKYLETCFIYRGI